MNRFTQQRNVQRASERKAISAFWAKVDRYNAEKIAAANVVLADIEKYGGETAGVVLSARIVLRNEAERRAAR